MNSFRSLTWTGLGGLALLASIAYLGALPAPADAQSKETTAPNKSEPKGEPATAPKASAEDTKSMNHDELRKKLDPQQFYVCIQNGTERPFENQYWNNHEEGIYVDVVDGTPLFASKHKFDSGSGWPSFFEPIDEKALVKKEDNSHGMQRIEVRAAKSNIHLGHLFPDGPKPTGLRYCINSAALKFIPVEKLKEAGYEKYLPMFDAETAKPAK